MIIVVRVFQQNTRCLILDDQAIEMGVDDRGVIVVAAGVHVLKRRYKECLQQSQARRYRNNATHPLPVY